MSQSATPVHVGRDVSFHTPDGEPVACVTVWLWTTTPLSARLLLTAHQWNHVRTAGLFDIADLDLAAEFSPVDSLLVDLEAVDPSLPTDTPALKKRFADPDSPLRSTEAWTATGVRDHESAAGPAAESTAGGGDGAGEDATAADAPRVSDVGISIQQSRSTAPTAASTAASGSGTEPSDWENLTEPLSHVAAALIAENRPFEPGEDGTSLSLSATVDHATWEVIVEDTTATGGRTDADTDEVDRGCLIRSLVPEPLGEARRRSLQSELDAYSATLNRGGFAVGSTGRVEFRTPFDPAAESTSDALTENVTALAEWFDRLTV